MTRETFDAVFEKIQHLKFRAAVLYHGGEPLLCRDFFYFVEKIRPLATFTKTVCNGSMLTDEKIDLLLHSSLDLVEFSLDGLSPEENNSIRVGSNFQWIACQILKLLKKRREMDAKLQIFLCNVQVPTPTQDTSHIEIPLYLKETFKDYLSDIAIRCFYSMYWPGYPRREPETRTPVRNRCDHIENTITIRWNGDVVSCCYDLTSKLVMGNLVRQALDEIWNGARYRALRSAIDQRKPPELCKGCNVIYEEKYLYPQDLAVFDNVAKAEYHVPSIQT